MPIKSSLSEKNEKNTEAKIDRRKNHSTMCVKESFTQGQRDSPLPSFTAVAERINYRKNPMFNKQSYLNQTSVVDINVVPAWDARYGTKPIEVGVIDAPIDLTHPDLQGSVLVEHSGLYDAKEGHGTWVAGILGAKDNDIGIIGVAPHAKIYIYDIGVRDSSQVLFQKLFMNDHTKIAVYNASIGNNMPDIYQKLLSENAHAFDMIAKEGFFGRGSNIVFAAGNANNTSTLDGYLHHYTVISANAIPIDGNVDIPKSNSGFTYGENLWITAPMAAVTTDNGGKYIEDFFATSSAAPLVSGAVALLRSEYPELTWRDVKLLLAESAKKYDFKEKAEYKTSGVKYYDGTEQQYSRRMGFGLLNVHRLLTMAENWELLPPMKIASCKSTKNYSIQKGKKEYEFDLVFENNDIVFIESVTLNFKVQSENSLLFYWNVFLNSPDGITKAFYLDFFDGSNTLITLLYNSYLGSSYVNGPWNVEIQIPSYDKIPSIELGDVELTIRGH